MPSVPNQVLILTVAVGVGIFLALAIVRIRFQIDLSRMLILLYVLLIGYHNIILSIFSQANEKKQKCGKLNRIITIYVI